MSKLCWRRKTIRPWLDTNPGSDPTELFQEFDWHPLGSASISQIYRAILRDGTPGVAIADPP
jgi:predicted unusual protein kinase regulating ubiquinone biosynthesis (AarF/ABC1/UbiB family)